MSGRAEDDYRQAMSAFSEPTRRGQKAILETRSGIVLVEYGFEVQKGPAGGLVPTPEPVAVKIDEIVELDAKFDERVLTRSDGRQFTALIAQGTVDDSGAWYPDKYQGKVLQPTFPDIIEAAADREQWGQVFDVVLACGDPSLSERNPLGNGVLNWAGVPHHDEPGLGFSAGIQNTPKGIVATVFVPQHTRHLPSFIAVGS